MLKRLELVGFKSFADKTRLDFDPGISAVVGPNGSGKSNIVDAIRWILGEQSAKSLRGKEMADCIFNGSGTRRSLGMAEVSLYLDNSRHYLPVPADEVVLSRRVYRSGESEYFINGQTARLRDIRDLFLGTGAGHHAYSIIEQGKVDQILQSSAKDRRFIFEEAAGISRFKARKIEALRRLERVAQNLVRVQDIREEVDKQLRSLRSQASKARRYRELAERYRLLRLQYACEENLRLRGELETIGREVAPLGPRIDAARQRLAQAEPRQAELDILIRHREASLRQHAGRLAQVRESISAIESEITNDDARAAELHEEWLSSTRLVTRGRDRLFRLDHDAGNVRSRYESALADRQHLADSQAADQERQVSLSAALDVKRRQRDEKLNASRQLFSELNRLENEQSAFDAQLSLLWQQRDKHSVDLAEMTVELDRKRRHNALLHRQELSVRVQQSAYLDRRSAIEHEHRRRSDERSVAQDRLAAARQAKFAVDNRIEILEQLSRRHEGLDAGAKTVLAERAAGDPIWQPVLGVLAEQLDVDPDLADLVELALGPRAQSLVVASLADLSRPLLDRARKLPGRVHFLSIDDPQGDRLVVHDETIAWPTLASLVSCSEQLRPLVDRLLGQTYLADDVDEARRAVSQAYDMRFVTRQGDILEPDGSLGAGPLDRTSGVIARTAEIRSLKEETGRHDASIRQLEQELHECDAELRRIEEQLNHDEMRRSTLAEQLRHWEILLRQSFDQIQAHEQLQNKTRRDVDSVRAEIDELAGQVRQADQKLESVHEQIREHRGLTDALTQEVDDNALRLTELTRHLQSSQTQHAVAEERLNGLRAEAQKIAGELEGGRLEVDALAGRAQTAAQRRLETTRRLLDNRAHLADLYAQKDAIAREIGSAPDELDAARQESRQITDDAQRLHAELALDQATLHRGEIRSTELRLKRDALATRLAEDYAVDLDAVEISQRIELPDDQIAREIDELREKIQRLGSVNAEAVAELDELERRSATFELQINDLEAARKHLEQLISRINDECRRLFVDTFETIRIHFQELFRKLFGGGKADIVLEDPNDVLESGIDIVARPPGKEPQSISLLSGGEKTMTAVSLVMAIFRSKPSPFCILDEVDAALDEANIGRFMQMLREYTNLSQFVVITHSKTTMAAADVLHGITQRESGVSIRVSVRLEDVTDDGQFIDSEGSGASSTDSAA
jgi:chromosome segregation protein